MKKKFLVRSFIPLSYGFDAFYGLEKTSLLFPEKKKIDDRENSDCIQLKYSSSGEDNNGFIHSQWVGTKKRN